MTYRTTTRGDFLRSCAGEKTYGVPGDVGQADIQLEYLIDTQAMRLHTAPTPQERRAAWDELTRLHGLRSPQRVRQMELERRLI